MEEEGVRFAEQLCVWQKGAECLQEDVQAARYDDDEGQQQEDSEVVDDLPIDCTRAFDVPNRVECFLDVGCEREQGVEQEYQTDADEDAAFGMLEVGLHEIEYCVGNVWISFERVPQLCLDDGVEAEASGNGEDDGQNGDGCQHAAVGEGRSIAQDVVLLDAFPSDDEPLQYPQPQSFHTAEPLFIDAPYVL